ncbi:DUF4304 domain-containing protein [Spongiactinospora sp. TRM90649]|uniref:DUF4304 domain-containing protein n=1 Tax=Spongiactinospora sp. TRM90649 TaxID=3031114 RepID=UPI0023F74EBE|nr:DUF4304 domain-containing protein [Spongiactinospora sp. TRM90649]MDF5753103.1 DUF4304 domain-containing protein [Spongiactinospora sp. TRM90649]
MFTAQETFRAMLRDGIAPALRDLGLTGSGQVYRLPDERHWAQLGFQRSSHNTSTQVRFTINLSVMSVEQWELYRAKWSRPLPDRPSASSYYGSWAWFTRIGSLMPGRRDLWWEVGTVPDPALPAEVVRSVRDYALPELRARLGHDD